jgi:hypothetical protein
MKGIGISGNTGLSPGLVSFPVSVPDPPGGEELGAVWACLPGVADQVLVKVVDVFVVEVLPAEDRRAELTVFAVGANILKYGLFLLQEPIAL